MGHDSAKIENLFSTKSSHVKKELKARLRVKDPSEIYFENKSWIVVHGLQPSHITTGRDPVIELNKGQFRPDIFAAFADDQLALVVECTYTDQSSYVTERIVKLKEAKRPLQELLQQEFEGLRLVCLLCVKDKSSLSVTSTKLAQQSDIRLIDDHELDYFLTLKNAVGIGIKYQFWARVAPKALQLEHKKVPAIQIKEGKRTTYIFSINAHELLKRALISHRELTDFESKVLGYQRMLKKSKLKSIERYLKERKGFPSPIIVSLADIGDEKFELAHGSTRKGTGLEHVKIGHLVLPTKPASI